METTHSDLFFGLRRDLKELCRNRRGGFKVSVSVKALLELECRYAEAETRMHQERFERTDKDLEATLARGKAIIEANKA